MKVTVCLLFLAILGFSSGSDSTTWFCDKSDDTINLDLSNIGIKTLRKSLVSSERIKCLNLGHNLASSIERDAFVGLPELATLDLSGNLIQFQDFAQFTELIKLKTLVLDGTFMMRNLENVFLSFETRKNVATFPHLRKLSMSNYGTSGIEHLLGKFDVPELKELRLNGNRLTSEDNLPRNIVKNLTHLYLDDNEIRNFSSNTLPNIRHLSMNNNQIETLCGSNCSDNAMSLYDMQYLEYLSLVGNRIIDIKADTFANSQKLKSLNLAENSIEEFPQGTFDSLQNLHKLTLDDNGLDHMPNICELHSLQELSINGNHITSINETTFCNLLNLNFVSLQKNGLTTVALETFKNLKTLKRLDMSWNNISQLPNNWMKSCESLEELNLDANKFNDIADISLGPSNILGHLSIACNPIKTITIGSMINLPANTTLTLCSACESQKETFSTDDSPETTYSSGIIYVD